MPERASRTLQWRKTAERASRTLQRTLGSAGRADLTVELMGKLHTGEKAELINALKAELITALKTELVTALQAEPQLIWKPERGPNGSQPTSPGKLRQVQGNARSQRSRLRKDRLGGISSLL